MGAETVLKTTLWTVDLLKKLFWKSAKMGDLCPKRIKDGLLSSDNVLFAAIDLMENKWSFYMCNNDKPNKLMSFAGDLNDLLLLEKAK